MLPVLFILFAVMMDSENLLAEGRKIFHYEKLWVEDGLTASTLYSNDMSSRDAQAWYGGYSYDGTVQMHIEFWKYIIVDGKYEFNYHTIPLPIEHSYFANGQSSWGNCWNIEGASPYVPGGGTVMPRIRLKLETNGLFTKDIGYAELVSFYP